MAKILKAIFFGTIKENEPTSVVSQEVLVSQSCPTLCNPMDSTGSSVMEFSRQEYWSGLPCPPPGDLPNPGIKSRSPTLQADSLPSEPPGKPWPYVQFSSVAQSCLTLWDPIDSSPPGSFLPEFLQERILQWVAISFSRESSQPRDQIQVSRIAGGFFTRWATREAQEYWSG